MNVVVFGVQQKRSMISLSNERPPHPFHEVRLPYLVEDLGEVLRGELVEPGPRINQRDVVRGLNS
jgi:hypothetical protein